MIYIQPRMDSSGTELELSMLMVRHPLFGIMFSKYRRLIDVSGVPTHCVPSL